MVTYDTPSNLTFGNHLNILRKKEHCTKTCRASIKCSGGTTDLNTHLVRHSYPTRATSQRIKTAPVNVQPLHSKGKGNDIITASVA